MRNLFVYKHRVTEGRVNSNCVNVVKHGRGGKTIWLATTVDFAGDCCPEKRWNAYSRDRPEMLRCKKCSNTFKSFFPVWNARSEFAQHSRDERSLAGRKADFIVEWCCT